MNGSQLPSACLTCSSQRGSLQYPSRLLSRRQSRAHEPLWFQRPSLPSSLSLLLPCPESCSNATSKTPHSLHKYYWILWLINQLALPEHAWFHEYKWRQHLVILPRNTGTCLVSDNGNQSIAKKCVLLWPITFICQY